MILTISLCEIMEEINKLPINVYIMHSSKGKYILSKKNTIILVAWQQIIEIHAHPVPNVFIKGLESWYSTSLSTIVQLYHAVSFIGGGNRSTRRKPLNCRKSLTNFIT